MAFNILTWNMDHWKRNSEQRIKAWDYLKSLDFNIAMLQETKPASDYFSNHDVFFNPLPFRGEWGSAILSKNYPYSENSFSSVYEGSKALMCYDFNLENDEILTVINVYGQFDSNGYANTTLHHMISDVTDIIHKNKRKRYVVMAGDMNISEQWDKKYKNRDPSHKIVFDRIEDLGLINSTKILENHVQTYVHPNSDVPWQLDYMFINKKLFNLISDCKVHNQEGTLDLSDHYLMEITFEI